MGTNQDEWKENRSQPISSCTASSVGNMNIAINRANSDIHSIRNYGPPACSRFEISAPFAEITLLGNVAILSGESVEWNRHTMTSAGLPSDSHYLRRPPRRGWSLQSR
jgi:hypothetical protein